jgi:hypothetical protein
VEKVVEKDKIVTVPTQDERSIKMELTLSLLVEKLITELRRLKKDNPSLNFQLEDDVKLIFMTELNQPSNAVSADFNARLKSYSDSVYRKFESLGAWSLDHQVMLNSFLQERFLMTNLIRNANLEIEKVKSIASSRDENMKRLETESNVLCGYIEKIRSNLENNGLMEHDSVFSSIFHEFGMFTETRVVTSCEPTRMLGDLSVSDARIQSLIR